MNGAAQDLAEYLQTQGRGTIGTSLFISQMPKSPILTATLYDTGSWREPQDEPFLDYPTVQILVRGDRSSGYRNAFNWALEIRDTLMAFRVQDLNGIHYGGIWLSNGPAGLGYDESKHPLISTNYRVLRSG